MAARIPKGLCRLLPGHLRLAPLSNGTAGHFDATTITGARPITEEPARGVCPSDFVDVLPTGETAADLGMPAGQGLPPHIYDFVLKKEGDFSPPPPAKTLTAAERRALGQQMEISRPGRPERRLIEMPLAAVDHPYWNFLDEPRTAWVKGWRWVYDPTIGVPVFINTPDAVEDSRGVVILWHGSCGANSGPHSLVGPGAQFNKHGFFAVCAPSPYHAGFGPKGPAYFDMESHIQWRRDVADASLDYFLSPNGALPRILVGRSTGGNEALEFSLRHPGAVQAVLALSPYHPGWWEIDQMALTTAERYGSAKLNHKGIRWNTALDWKTDLGRGQWTFMGDNTPAFPTNTAMTASALEAIFQGLQNRSPDQIREAFRVATIRDRLPQALRDHPGPLIELTDEALRQLLPDVDIPNVESDSFLARTTTPTLIYVAGPDLEYLAADPYHFIVWVLAAARNPYVKIVLAPRGDHDPFQWDPKDRDKQEASQAFRDYAFQWLDTVIPRTHSLPRARNMQWGDKLRLFYAAWEKRRNAGLPAEAKIAEIRETDGARADQLAAAKQDIVEQVGQDHGVRLTVEDMVNIGNRLLQKGVLNVDDKRVRQAFGQLTNNVLGLREVKNLLQGITTLQGFMEAVQAVVNGSRP